MKNKIWICLLIGSIAITMLLWGCTKKEVPVLTTSEISNITATTATCGGTITSEGSSQVIARGVCLSITSNPTIADYKTTGGTGTGNFVCNISGLIPNTNYFVRAYATNNEGTGYGEEVSFSTDPLTVPIITTTLVNSITPISAVSGGIILSDGEASITDRGICWSTDQNPTISDNKTTDGSGLGSFSSSIIGLTQNTTFYVRAYATNNIGTGYGDNISFRTLNREILFNSSITYGSISDTEGNIYKTVNIGTQIWMAENLKTTKYNDGTAIPLVTDNTAWTYLKTPAYCWYNNNSANKDTYGGLYNHSTVNTGKLCPLGWHVPTTVDWTTLEHYLFEKGYNLDGTVNGSRHAKALGSSSGWVTSSVTGTVGNPDYPALSNATGFTALPAGYRNEGGKFYLIGYVGGWWDGVIIRSDYQNLITFPNYFKYPAMVSYHGLSVRCIKDQDY